jgi:hypothetical protein
MLRSGARASFVIGPACRPALGGGFRGVRTSRLQRPYAARSIAPSSACESLLLHRSKLGAWAGGRGRLRGGVSERTERLLSVASERQGAVATSAAGRRGTRHRGRMDARSAALSARPPRSATGISPPAPSAAISDAPSPATTAGTMDWRGNRSRSHRPHLLPGRSCMTFRGSRCSCCPTCSRTDLGAAYSWSPVCTNTAQSAQSVCWGNPRWQR